MVAVVAFNKPVPEIFDGDGKDPGFAVVQDAITIAAVESIGQRRADVFNIIAADKTFHQARESSWPRAVRRDSADSRAALGEGFRKREQVR